MDSFPEQFSALQQDFLAAFFAREPRFCLIGGGALAYYLPHRQARDLDLVGPEEVALSGHVATLQETARSIGARTSFPERSSDLLRCLLHRAGEILQIDLGTRTAPIRVGEKRRFGAILVESRPTLAAHKLLALCYRARPRDLRDLGALLDTGLSLAEIVAQTLRRQPELDAASLYAELASWPARVQPEDAAELAELGPLWPGLLHRLRGLCFDIARRRAPAGPALPPTLSPLQGDILHAFFRRERRFCLTGSAALAYYVPGWPVDDLALQAPPDVDLGAALGTLQQSATSCGGQAEVVRAAPRLFTVRVLRDSECCLVELSGAAPRAPALPRGRFGEVAVASPRALAGSSLAALGRRGSVTDFLQLKAVVDDLGVSLGEAVQEALALDEEVDPPGLAWALATLRAPDDSLARPLYEAAAFHQELLREVRRAAHAQARSRPWTRAQAVLSRDGARPIVGRRPILYTLGGGFAAGKSRLRTWLTARGLLPSTNVVRVDPDEILVSLPAYGDLVRRGQLRTAGDALHPESNAIAREVLRRAMDMRADIVHDVALGDPDRALQQLQAAREAGYEVHLIGVTVDPPIAIARAAARDAEEGRHTSTADLLASHQGFSEGFPAYSSVAESVRLYDTSGDEPMLIASRDAQAGGEVAPLSVHDPERYERFKAKADLDGQATRPPSTAGTAMSHVLIGNEFTFTDEAMVQAADWSRPTDVVVKLLQGPYEAALERWRAAMERRGITAHESQHGGHPALTYEFPDLGWKYAVTWGGGCVEVITPPVPARDLYEGGIAAALDDCLFAVAQEAGLAAHPTIGGGHINLDRASAFGDDPDALLRFILAFYEDAEYWKQEDGDRAHAPFPEEHQPSQQAKFAAAVERFQEARQGPSPWGLDRLADELRSAFDENLLGKAAQKSPHYQAINLEHMNAERPHERRLELRRVPAQRDRAHLLQHLTRIGGLL